MFIFAIASCGGSKKSIYDEYADDEPETNKGEIGDPCMKNSDCKDDLVCINKVCSKPSSTDEDIADTDSDDDNGEKDDTDTDTNADTGTHDGGDTAPDKDTADSGSDDGGDTASDQDNGESHSGDDSDTQEYVPECGNGAREPGEECDNGVNNSDEPGILNITCRTNCTWARCGDGIVDSSEICDDGNMATGDYCSPDCNAVTGRCGDGIRQAIEICDWGTGIDRDPYCSEDCQSTIGYCGDGKLNGDEMCDNAEPDVGAKEGIGPEYCSVDCKAVIGSCGDGTVQLNEKCDDKGLNGTYGHCNATCSGKGPYCGDGILDEGHEVCDRFMDDVYCSDDCQTYYGKCGDGIVQNDYEACDKAPAGIGDGTGAYCSDDCQESHGYCGDGIIFEAAGEECDNRTNNDPYCEYGLAACTVCIKCKKTPGIGRYCGDGVVSGNEVCDKATFGDDAIGPYYCSDDCMHIIGSCGDGIQQPNEFCDPAKEDDPRSPYCSDDCKSVSGGCGDGRVNGDEQCDEAGNNGKLDCDYGVESCTVCTSECKTQPGRTHKCGDGTIDLPDEDCDDGGSNGSYGKCKADCSGLGPHCGDGITDPANGEQCDKGDANGQTECEYGQESCKVCTKDSCQEVDGNAKWCGDGIVNRADCEGFSNCIVTPNANESCDDGINDGQYGHCGVNCYDKNQYCGDGIQNGGESCDDGVNDGSYGSCLSDCSDFGPRCGDGVVDYANGEVCDDGGNNGKYSPDSLNLYCNSDCKGRGEGGYCGDETQQADNEQCDWGDGNGRTPCPYGETSCKVCSSRCRLVNGLTHYCGDGNTDEGEFCDAGENNGDYNKPCNSYCTAVPPQCGDGKILRENCEGYTNCVVINGMHINEECDDGDNNGYYQLEKPGSCNSDCQDHGEGGYCGDGFVNGYETCDDNELINGSYGGNCNERCNGYTARCGDKVIHRNNCEGYSNCVVIEGLSNDKNEECDEGDDVNGTYGHCNSDCSAVSGCGDGIVQTEEQCDDSGNNGKYSPTSQPYCNSDCQGTGEGGWCGDGLVDSANGEACDSGEDNGKYGFCNSDCSALMPKCGDGKIQRSENCDGYTNCVVIEGLNANEECDDGTENGEYGKCNLECTGISRCGDGVQQLGYENCDESDDLNGTYGHCNNSCTAITGFCDDGILQKASCGGTAACFEIPGADEECDKGYQNGNTKCAYGEKSCVVCTKQCKIASGTDISYCGDGDIDEENGELCDDGTQNGTFGKCDETCREEVTWRCGDNNHDFTKGEECDEGDDVNGTYMILFPGHCNSNCKGTGEGGWCGDGKIQKVSEDHCGSLPLCDETTTTLCCEIVQFAAGEVEEECDEGEGVNGTSGHCNLTCNGMTPVCGNGTVELGETCDDGEDTNGKYSLEGTCNINCNGKQAGGWCGDGKIQKASDEECELLSIPVCDENTTENCCEVVDFAEGNSPETCDEGSSNGYHGHCNLTCSGTSSCGDGEVGRDEICEPGTMDEPWPCSMFRQFSGGTVNTCDSECMPVLENCVNATSYTIPFFDTKQTLCYDNSAQITCPASTESFYGQSPQFTYITPDFTAGDDIVHEANSNTMWQKATPAVYEGCMAGTSCTFEEAAAYCENSTLGGYTNWRLPSAFEFTIIADFEAIPHIDPEFDETDSYTYWTAEGLAFSAADATIAAQTAAQVKCIRDVNEKEVCTICGNDLQVFEYNLALLTAFDETTIALWYFGDPIAEYNWEDALAFCQNISFNGINKMRLPTASELILLIDPMTGHSLIPGFADTAWTSTTLSGSAANTSKAYVVNFSTLSLTTDDKANSNYVICVE